VTVAKGERALVDDTPHEPADTALRVQRFDDFYRDELRSCMALAYSLCGNRGLAEEIAQEAMTAVYRDWDRVRQMEFPGSWVRRATANLATSSTRRRMAEARAVVRLSSRRQDDTVLPESDEDFWGAVRRLPRRQAQATALRYGLGCSVAETADILGCAEGTVKASLHAARASISRRLGLEAAT
jgi:RNA polymerase sigma-70 factor (ECF subfamily)